MLGAFIQFWISLHAVPVCTYKPILRPIRPISAKFISILNPILDSFTSSVGFYGLPFYWPHVFILAYFWPKIYKLSNTAYRLGLYWAVSAVALFTQYWGWFWLYVVVFKYADTVVPLAVYNFGGGAFWIFLLIYALIPSAILTAFPSFVKPEWKFANLKWWTLAVVVIFLALAATKA